MSNTEFWDGMADLLMDLDVPFTPEQVKSFEMGFIELHDGRLYRLKFEQLDPGPNDLIDVL